VRPIPMHKASGPQIVFTSDQSVILTSKGSSYQFVAHVETQPHHISSEPLQWSSSDPSLVGVDSMGNATAESNLGSASLFVTAAGAQAQAAQVTIATPGPNTVIVASQDVLGLGRGSATLVNDTQTQSIVAGDILVSGNRAGLLVTVLGVTSSALSLIVTTTPASLVQAFPELSIRAESAPTTLILSYNRLTGVRASPADPTSSSAALTTAFLRGGGAPKPEAGRHVTRGLNGGIRATQDSSSAIHCTSQHGTSVLVTLAGPTVSVTATINLIGVLASNSQGLHFVLAIQAKVPVVVTTGSLTVSASGTEDVTCDWNIGSFDLPTPLFIGPIEIDGVGSVAASVDIMGDAHGNLTLTGPTASDTAAVYDGIEYNSSGGWTTLHSNGQSGVHVEPAASTFTASVALDFSASARVDFGVSANLGLCSVHLCITLAQSNLVFAKASGDLNFQVATPLDHLQAGYTGPAWSAGLEFTAGPEIDLSGAIPTLLGWLGVPLPNGQWNLLDLKYPLASSPQISATVSGNTAPGGSATLTATVPSGFVGDTAHFALYPKAGGEGKVAASAQVQPNDSATAQVTVPPEGLNGYEAAALLDAPPFGSNLPYASTINPPPSPVGPGTGPPLGGSSSGWSSPVSIDPNGGGLTSVSCPTPSFCAAVDGDGNALTFNGNTWSSAQNIDPNQGSLLDPGGGGLTNVSCATPSFCVAVGDGGGVILYNGSTWSTPQNVDTSGRLAAASCRSASSCMAVGYDGTAYSYTGTWAQSAGFPNIGTASDLGFLMAAVDCASTTFCIAVDGAGDATIYSNGAWSQPQSIDPAGDGLDGISCVPISFCVAQDYGGNVVTYSSGAWSQPVSVDPFGVGVGSNFGSSGNDSIRALAFGVTCASASFCLALDGGGNALSFANGSWSSPVSIDFDGGGLTGMSCPSVSFCLAVDFAGNALSYSGSS
jgi:hypothetical protein